jgi:hypothetical protein
MSGSEGGKAEILPANNANSREWGRIQKIICHGFYSRGFASFAGKGGMAADVGLR